MLPIFFSLSLVVLIDMKSTLPTTQTAKLIFYKWISNLSISNLFVSLFLKAKCQNGL